MINWMQKHKKYLIPTVWISGIAFVGAGFVGWGAYDLNKDKSTSVAKVGNTPITIQEFQMKYNDIYSYFSSLLDSGLTKEKADEMNLDQMALAALIQETMLLNYAKDLGLNASDEDVAKYMLALPAFQKDGKFSKDLYFQTIQHMGIKPSDYEKSLKKAITRDKLNHALNLNPKKQDLQMLASAYFMQDKISLQIISKSNEDTVVDDNETKKFWENNKNNYMTTTSYDLSTSFVSPNIKTVDDKELISFYDKNKNNYRNTDDKLQTFEEAKQKIKIDYLMDITKDQALRKYLSLKKGEEQFESELTVFDDNISFPIDIIKTKKEGEIVKPFEYKNGNLIVKIKKINTPRIMSFDEAKDMAKQDYTDKKTKDLLEKEAKQTLKNFNGTDIGYVSRDTRKSIKDLNEDEFSFVLNQIFDNNEKEGYVTLENKAVIYKITDQNLTNLQKTKEYAEILLQNASNVINNDFQQDLLNALQKKYKVQQYYKGNRIEQ